MDIINKIKNHIDRLVQERETIIIAIDGKSGSGKSSLAKKLGKTYESNIFHMDDFFLPGHLRSKERLREIGGNVDYKRFKGQVLEKILARENFSYRVFDCRLMEEAERINVGPKKINIIEGSYSMHPSLIEAYDLKIFLDIDNELQKDRILKRNGPLMIDRFIGEWIPKENLYFDQMKIREKSDLYFMIER